MIQNKKLKRNATYAIAEVAEVALCASNCALPTSGNRLTLQGLGNKQIGVARNSSWKRPKSETYKYIVMVCR